MICDFFGQVAFGAGAESMVACRPYGVMTPASLSSIHLYSESESAYPIDLEYLVGYLGFGYE